MNNEQQQKTLSEIGIPLWVERPRSAKQETPSERSEGLGISLSGSADSGYLWLLEDRDISTSEKALLTKVQLAAAGEDDSLLASYQPDSEIDFAATIKDQLVTRVVVFGSAEFITKVVAAIGSLTVEVIASSSLTELAESNSLKRKLWEQLKAVSS